MNKKFTLSISAFILAGFLTGCSDDNKNEEPVKETKTALQGANESKTDNQSSIEKTEGEETPNDSLGEKTDENSKETSEKENSKELENSPTLYTSKDVSEGKKVDLGLTEGEKAAADKEEKEAQEAEKKFQIVREKMNKKLDAEQKAADEKREKMLKSKDKTQVAKAKEDTEEKIADEYYKSQDKIKKVTPKSKTDPVYNQIKEDYSKMMGLKYQKLRKQIIEAKQKGESSDELMARKERASLEIAVIKEEGFKQMDDIFNKAKNPTNYGSYAAVLQSKYKAYSDALDRI